MHGHSSSSELSAHQMAPPDERTSMVDANGHAWVRLDTAPGSYWQNLDTRHTQWTRLGSAEVPQIQFIDFVVVEAEPGYIIMHQSTETFVSIPCPVLARAVRT